MDVNDLKAGDRVKYKFPYKDSLTYEGTICAIRYDKGGYDFKLDDITLGKTYTVEIKEKE